MSIKIRFGTFIQEIAGRERPLSYNELVPELQTDAGGEALPYRPDRLQLRPAEVYAVIQPYVGVRLLEQLRAVVPLALYLMLFQLLVLRQNVTDSTVITAGLLSVIVGLVLFMEGLKVGLMPFGQIIGTILPSRSALPTVLTITLLLGIGVTFAEPAIGALKTAGSNVRAEDAPYLYALLNQWADVLVLGVGAGVGLAAVVGTLRFLYGWSLKPLVYLTLIPTIGLSLYISADPQLREILGLAWDCGAVTTGPITVPLMLSLGIGIAAAAGKGDSSLSGFGIVTLASLFPIMTVMLLALYVANISSPAELIATAAASAAVDTGTLAWHARTPWLEVIGGIRAIVPLVIFLLLVLSMVLREKLSKPGEITYGISLALLGMIIFNIGLSYGLAKLGGQSGGLVPAAFTQIEIVANSPLYSFGFGILVALLFAWFLGFGATLAEPALNALGLTVENLTNGAFPKRMLMRAVAFGVGCGIALGILKIIFSIPIIYLLLPGYLLAVIMTALSTEEYVNIAWDSAGVTTGPVTVPLVLSMGIGFGNAVGAVEGFGILSMASIGPILAVLGTGLWIQWKIRRRHEQSEQQVIATPETVT